MASFQKAMDTVNKTASDILDDLHTSGFLGNVIPTAESFGKELAKGIESNKAVKANFYKATIESDIKARLSTMYSASERAGKKFANVDLETLSSQMSRALHNIKEENFSEEAVKQLADIMRKNKVDEKQASTLSSMIGKAIDKTLENPVQMQASIMGSNGLISHPVTYAKTYFTNPDSNVRFQRAAAVGGTYAGLAIGGRVLSGGSLTKDEYGQRDIAGIPFI